MTPRTMLGSVLLASASECGSLEALAIELGVSRQALAGIVSGATPSLPTFAAVVRYLGIPADEVLAMMAAEDTGEPWRPDHAAGGKARQGSLCTECGERMSRAAAATRWAESRARASEGQMTLTEAG